MTAIPETASGSMLARPVSGLLEATLEAARRRGRADIAGILDAEAAPRQDAVAIVVVGETGRGKSTLVNALLGRDLCPTDLERRAPAYVLVRYATDPIARVHRLGSVQPREVRLSDVRELLQADPDAGDRGPVVEVEVGVPNELLESGLVVIDAPGVGGLDAAPARTTLAVLPRADALVFVLDAAAPLSRPELQFLERATERIGAVLFVLTKIDAYHAWQEILAEDQRLLAEHVPQFAGAPFFPVSSTEKRAADAMGDLVLAAESGLPALEAGIVDGVIGRRSRLRELNALQTIRIALQQLDEPEHAIGASLAVALGDEGRGTAAAAALHQHKSRTQDWHVTLTYAFQRQVRNRLDLEFQRRLAAVSRGYESRIHERKLALEGLQGDLELELHAVATDMDTLVVTTTRDLALQLMSKMGLEPDEERVARLARGQAPPKQEIIKSVRAPRDPAQRLRNISLMTGPTTAGRLLAPLIGVPSSVGAGVGAAVGGALSLGSDEFGRRAHSRAEAIAIVHDGIAQGRLEIDAHLRNRVLDAQETIQAEMAHAVDARGEALQGMLADEHTLRGGDTERRDDALVRAQTRLDETERLWEAALILTRRVATEEPL